MFRCLKLSGSFRRSYSDGKEAGGEVFRVLKLKPDRARTEDWTRDKIRVQEPRYKRMPIDQDWPSVWPTAQSFKASAIPFPVMQGYQKNDKPPPDRFGNLELMKIPNFLHLAPQAVKRHCAAIKKFCTPWPEGLETEDECSRHFPLTVISSDYVHSGSSIRDERARIVTIQVKLSDLGDLDKHARDKFLRLVGKKYDEETDLVTIVTDRCPLRKQNYDFGVYLLTALVHESKKTEPWESEKEAGDLMEYAWDHSVSQASVVDVIKRVKQCTEEEAKADPKLAGYSEAVTTLHNEGETEDAVLRYKQSVLQILRVGDNSAAPATN